MKVQTNFRAGLGLSDSAEAAQPEGFGYSSQGYDGTRFSSSPNQPYSSRLEGGPSFNAWIQDAISQRLTPRLETKVISVESNRLWEIDALRGFALIIMLGIHFMYSWLRVWSGTLADLANTAWVTIKPVFAVFVVLPVLLGAVFFAPNSHPKVAELREKGPFL